MVKKFLISISIATSVALVYVYQHTEIFKLAYLQQKKSTYCQELLDKNTYLRYNDGHISSLPNLGSKILDGTEFEIPLSTQLAKLNLLEEVTLNRETKVRPFGFFNIRLRQAEAKTVAK